MRLTMQDKNEFLKAALKARDLESLKLWVVSVVDALDSSEAANGKADVHAPVPPYVAPAANGHGPVQSLTVDGVQDSTLAYEQWEKAHS
jgi:hypothetical protein